MQRKRLTSLIMATPITQALRSRMFSSPAPLRQHTGLRGQYALTHIHTHCPAVSVHHGLAGARYARLLHLRIYFIYCPLAHAFHVHYLRVSSARGWFIIVCVFESFSLFINNICMCLLSVDRFMPRNGIFREYLFISVDIRSDIRNPNTCSITITIIMLS